MARYLELYLGNELNKLREGLDIIERVIDSETIESLQLYLFGIVTGEAILDTAKEAIASEQSELRADGQHVDETDVSLSEIAVSIPISNTSVIDLLHGRGVPVEWLTFVYQTGEGEGVRELGFDRANTTSSRIRIESMGKMAIAETDTELPEFFKTKRTQGPVDIKRKVERDEEATENSPIAPGLPKQTSLNVSDIVEGFLG